MSAFFLRITFFKGYVFPQGKRRRCQIILRVLSRQRWEFFPSEVSQAMHNARLAFVLRAAWSAFCRILLLFCSDHPGHLVPSSPGWQSDRESWCSHICLELHSFCLNTSTQCSCAAGTLEFSGKQCRVIALVSFHPSQPLWGDYPHHSPEAEKHLSSTVR